MIDTVLPASGNLGRKQELEEMSHAHRFTHQAMRLRPVLCFTLATLACFSPLRAEQGGPRVPVSINLRGDDGLTQKLSYHLKQKVNNDRRLALQRSDEAPAFTITSDTGVSTDALDGRKVIIYHVKLYDKHKLVGDMVGVCYEKNVPKCADNIISRLIPIIWLSRYPT